MGSQRTGGKGKDVVLRLPRGTQIFAEDNETLLVDLTEIGQRVVLPRAATAATATCTTRARPTARRAAPTRAGRARSAGSGCG